MGSKFFAKIKDKFEDVVDFFVYNPFNIRYFCEKICGTWEYLKFIWENDSYKEWDFEYLYDLMAFKLKRMGKQLKKDNFVVDSDVREEEIQLALSFYSIYKNVDNGDYDHNNVDVIREVYHVQQKAWNKFHDILRDNAQKWWS